MNESLYPISIDVSHTGQHLSIVWSDEYETVFPLYGLRVNCPCVACRGGHGSMNVFEPEAFFEKNPPEQKITKIEPIGNHAIQIFWGDGHNSGMYRWETLRQLYSAMQKMNS